MKTAEAGGAQGDGGGPSHQGPTPGTELSFNAIPRAECGELQGCHPRKTDPNHWRIPTSIHLASITGLGGVLDTLPGPRYHSVRGPQSQNQPSSEPAQSEGCCYDSGVQAYGTPTPHPSVMAIRAHEELVSGETGKSDAGKM